MLMGCADDSLAKPEGGITSFTLISGSRNIELLKVWVEADAKEGIYGSRASGYFVKEGHVVA